MGSTVRLKKEQQDLQRAEHFLKCSGWRCSKLEELRDQTRLHRQKLVEREKQLKMDLAQEAAQRQQLEEFMQRLKQDMRSVKL